MNCLGTPLVKVNDPRYLGHIGSQVIRVLLSKVASSSSSSYNAWDPDPTSPRIHVLRFTEQSK